MIAAVHLPRAWLRWLAGLAIVVFITVPPRQVCACTCVVTSAIPASAVDLLANHAAVFEGRVVGNPEPSEPPPDAGYQERLAALEAKIERQVNGLAVREVHLDVLRSWKGAAERAVVRTQGQRTACGYPFEVGHTYLVFAHRGEDGALWVNSCGRTRPSEAAEAEADRALLDAQVGGPTTASAAPRCAACAGCTVAGDAGAGGVVALAPVVLAAERGRRPRR
jgi:hypothetical protein